MSAAVSRYFFGVCNTGFGIINAQNMGRLETQILKVKTLTPVNQRKVSALVGATVADAATRPLHWIYDQDKLDKILNGSKEPEFWPQSESPFYTIPLGQVSAYNDTSLVTLSALNETFGKIDINHICSSFQKHFGPGTDYADALARRKTPYNPAKRSEFIGPIEGPWVQRGMILFLQKYERNNYISELKMGGEDVKEHDGFCAALPVIALHAEDIDMWEKASKLCSLLTAHDETMQMFHTEALIVQKFILGADDPVNNVKDEIEHMYPLVHELLEEVEEATSFPFVSTVAQLGKACYLPASSQSAFLALSQTSSYVDAVRLNITAGGCNCCRANVIGACFGAKYGIEGIPLSWLKKVQDIEEIVEKVVNLISYC